MTDNQSAMNELLLSFVSKRAVSRDVSNVWQSLVNEESEESEEVSDDARKSAVAALLRRSARIRRTKEGEVW